MQYFFDTWMAFAHKREFTDAGVDGFPKPADIVELRAQHPAERRWTQKLICQVSIGKFFLVKRLVLPTVGLLSFGY